MLQLKISHGVGHTQTKGSAGTAVVPERTSRSSRVRTRLLSCDRLALHRPRKTDPAQQPVLPVDGAADVTLALQYVLFRVGPHSPGAILPCSFPLLLRRFWSRPRKLYS